MIATTRPYAVLHLSMLSAFYWAMLLQNTNIIVTATESNSTRSSSRRNLRDLRRLGMESPTFNERCTWKMKGDIECPNLCGQGKDFSAPASIDDDGFIRCLRAEVKGCSLSNSCTTESGQDLYRMALLDPEGICVEMCDGVARRHQVNFYDYSPNQPGEMGVRFRKYDMERAFTGYGLYSFSHQEYPFPDDVGDLLMDTSTGISIVTNNDPEVPDLDTLTKYMAYVDAPPTYPDFDPTHGFWSEFREVVQAQVDRRAGRNLSNMRLPNLWANYSVHEIAENVHDEYPGYWQSQFLLTTIEGGALRNLDLDVIPCRGKYDFVGGLVRLAELNTWAVGVVSVPNFWAKWHYGRPRPEEVAWMIATGEIEQDVPIDLVATIQGWKLESPESFTAYTEGSPRHPSWPAMHSAASSTSFWLSVISNLTEEQYCQALLTDYIVSYGRLVAGVHYASDNIAGLNLGQAIVADKLVPHLVERYGANAKAAQAKVDSMRFDWNDFDPLTCKISKRVVNLVHY